MRKYLFLLCGSIYLFIAPIHALFKVGFVDIFPTLRATTRNFNEEPIDRLFYTQYHLNPKAVIIGLDYQTHGFHFFLGLDFMKNLEAEFGNMAWTNMPIGPNMAAAGSSDFPSEAFISYQNELLSVSIGRRRAHLGPGKYSLMLSEDTPYFDGLWFSINPETKQDQYFVYTFFLAADDTAALKRLWEEFDPAHLDVMENDRYAQRTKFLAVHRVGYQFEYVRFGIAESSVIYGIPMTFFNVNPAGFWHNTYEVGLNVALGLDVEALVGTEKNVRLYSEFLLDDASIGGAGNPLGIGLSLGVEWQIFSNDEEYLGADFDYRRYALSEQRFRFSDSGFRVGFQAIWASTYLYARDKLDPLGKFTFHNQLQLGVGHWSVMENYIGFSYGPDTILLELQAKYKNTHWKIDGALGLLLWGAEGSSNSGFLPVHTGNVSIGGLFNPKDTANQLFSGLERLLIIPNVRVFYAQNEWLSYYGGFYAELDTLHLTRSRATLESGVAMRF